MTNVTSPLSGIRIWLSTARAADSGPEQKDRYDAFIREFAELVFRDGGKVFNGFNPDVAPVLLDAVKSRQDPKNRLALLVSTSYLDRENLTYEANGKDGQRIIFPVAQLTAACDFQQIPAGSSPSESLQLLHLNLAAQTDVLVAVGGNWWNTDRTRAGVPGALIMAINRGMPAFALGGFGGAVGGFLEDNEGILSNLRNGLDRAGNRQLASEQDPVAAARKVVNQIKLLPLGRRETSSNGQPYRILCLDGGGVRGAFSAAVLAEWEQLSGRKVADHFDLIAGTSTGGILAIGLGLGLTPAEMVKFYRAQGRRIFPELGFVDKFKQALDAKYDAETLEACLREAYDRGGGGGGPAKVLRDSSKRLLVLSYNLRANAIKLFRTSHSPDVPGHDDLAAVAAGLATSAAPTYFDSAMVEDPLSPYEAVDGGIWANCPAMAAVGEAVAVLKYPLDRIEVLSIGTAALPVEVHNPKRQGVAGWALQLTDLFMNSQMDGTQQYLRDLLGSRFVRVDDPVPRVKDLDDTAKVEILISRGVEVGAQRWLDVKDRFINGVPAQPWR